MSSPPPSRTAAAAGGGSSPASAVATRTTQSEATTTPTETIKTDTKRPYATAPLIWSGPPNDPIGMPWPPGWLKEIYGRGDSASKARGDSYWFSPVKKYRLRSLQDVHRFLKALPLYDNNEDLAIRETVEHKKRKTKRKAKADDDDDKPSASSAAPPGNLKTMTTPTNEILAPKVPSSAYEFFCTEQRPKLSQEGTNHQEINKKLDELWRALSPEQKETYQTMAQVDSIRYWSEMELYAARKKKQVQDSGATGKEALPPVVDATTVRKAEAGAPKRAIRKAEAGAPKRPITAYNYFFKLERERILNIVRSNPSSSQVNNHPDSPDYINKESLARISNANGTTNMQELVKLVGQRWKSLSAEEALKYREMADQDLQRYNREQAKFLSRSSSSGAELKKNKEPKQAMSAYNYFFKLERERILNIVRNPSSQVNHPDSPDYIDEDCLARISKADGTTNVQELVKLVGQRWKSLSGDELLKYRDMVEQDSQGREQADLLRGGRSGGGGGGGSGAEPRKKKRRRKKDRDAPKRPGAAYNFFFQREAEKIVQQTLRGEPPDGHPADSLEPARRAQLRLENGKVSSQEVCKLVGQRWRALSEREREPYHQQAARDAERYEREVEQYQAEQQQKKKKLAPAEEEEGDVVVVVAAAEEEEEGDVVVAAAEEEEEPPQQEMAGTSIAEFYV